MDYQYCLFSWDKKGVRSRKEAILLREHLLWGFNCDTIMRKAAT